MKNITIFGLWLLTVLLGSFIFTCGMFILNAGENAENFFGIILICMFFSGLFSLPAIFAFLISNNNLRKKLGNTPEYRRKMYKIHLLTGGLYFAVAIFIVLLEGADSMAMLAIIGLLLSYLPAGLLSWYVFFNMASNSTIEYSEEIIDDFVNE